MRRLLLPVFAALCALAPAQNDALIVEKQRDQRAANRLMAAFRKIRFDFEVAEVSPEQLCRYLASLTGDKVNFLVRDREAMADVNVTLRLGRTDMPTAMGAIQAATGLRFVYCSGIVFLARKDDVKPFTVLRIYNLRGATAPLRNFPGPKIGLGLGGDSYLEPEPEESSTTVSGFTADRVEDLIRTHVTPDAWDSGGVTMSNQNGTFLIRHTPQGHQQVRQLLYTLGVMTPPRVLVRPKVRPAAPRPRSTVRPLRR